VTATDQINKLLTRAADLHLPLSSVTVDPAFWNVLAEELRQREPIPEPVYFDGVRQPAPSHVGFVRLVFNGPFGTIQILKGVP
jgi:hypothetical protein